MINQYQIIDSIVEVIEIDGELKAIAERYPEPSMLYVGRLGQEALLNSSKRLTVSVGPPADPYDLGYNGEGDRVIPVSVLVTVHDLTDNQDGRKVDFQGVRNLSDYVHRLTDAIKAIDGLGDELANAEITIDSTETWPLCVALVDLRFNCHRGLNFEPAIT